MSLEIRTNPSGQTAQAGYFRDTPRVVQVSFESKTRVAHVVVDGTEVKSNRLKTFMKCGDSAHLVLNFGVENAYIVIAC